MAAQAVLNRLNGRCGDAEGVHDTLQNGLAGGHHAERAVFGANGRMVAGCSAGPQPAHADRMVEPGRELGTGGLEADLTRPSGSRRPPDRERQATLPQDAQERHRRTAGRPPASRRSIYRARRRRAGNAAERAAGTTEQHRDAVRHCAAERLKSRPATPPGPSPGIATDFDRNRESKNRDQRPPQGNQEAAKLKNHSKMLKISPATARRTDLIADPGGPSEH